MTLANRTRELRRAGLWPAVFLLGMNGMLLATIMAGWGPDLRFVGQMVAWLGAMRLAMTWRALRLGIRSNPATWLWACAAIIGGVLVSSVTDPERFVANAITSLATALLFGFVTEWFAFQVARVRLPSGTRLKTTLQSLRALTLARVPHSDSLAVIPHRGLPLDNMDSRFVLTHLTKWATGLPDRIIDQGHALVSHTSDLGELLDLLPSTDGGGIGEWRLDDLPLAWWVALDLALTRDARRHEASERAREIGEVASIAESLDRG